MIKAFNIQHNAHLVPLRFHDILITDDKEEIERLSKTYLEIHLKESHIKGIGNYRGIICHGDLGEDIENAECYKKTNRNKAK